MKKNELAWLTIRSAGAIMIIYGLAMLVGSAISSSAVLNNMFSSDALDKQYQQQTGSSLWSSGFFMFLTMAGYAVPYLISGIYLLFRGKLVHRLITRDNPPED